MIGSPPVLSSFFRVGFLALALVLSLTVTHAEAQNTKVAPTNPSSGAASSPSSPPDSSPPSMMRDQPSKNPAGQVRGRYGEWELRCDTPIGASREQCALLQSVVAEDKPSFAMDVIVLKTADGKNRLLRVIAPLGVLLPNGLGLKVDETDIGRAGFVRCIPRGCVAEVVMEDKLIEQMRMGSMATFIIYETPESGVGLPLALKGFQQGFDALP